MCCADEIRKAEAKELSAPHWILAAPALGMPKVPYSVAWKAAKKGKVMVWLSVAVWCWCCGCAVRGCERLHVAV